MALAEPLVSLVLIVSSIDLKMHEQAALKDYLQYEGNHQDLLEHCQAVGNVVHFAHQDGSDKVNFFHLVFEKSFQSGQSCSKYKKTSLGINRL